MTQKLGLNLGSGREYQETTASMRWINIDSDASMKPDIVASVEYVSDSNEFDGEFDEILAKDILEHIPYREDDQTRWLEVLRGWIRCLKPGGTITIQVPEFTALFQRYSEDDISLQILNRVLFGESTGLLDRHYQVFDLHNLSATLIRMGLEIVSKRRVHVCAVIMARKP